MNKTLLRCLMASGLGASLLASAALADTYVFRRALVEKIPAQAELPSGDEEPEADPDDGFDADPLVVGGSFLRGRSEGDASLTMYGITVHGGKAPYTISVSGDLAVSQRIFYRAENYGSQALFDTSPKPGGICRPTADSLLCLYSDVVFGSPFDKATAYYYTPIDGPEVNRMRYGIHNGRYVSYTYVEEIASCFTGSGSASMSLNDVFEASEVASPAGDAVISHAVYEYLGVPVLCGGYDKASVLGAVEMDLSPYVETAPGDYDFRFTVTDAQGKTAYRDTTFRIKPLPCGLPVTFETAGTFIYTPAPGCSSFMAEAYGGGANGVPGPGTKAQGGGGGAYAKSVVGIDASSYQVTVGAAGGDSAVKKDSTTIVLAKGASGTSGASKALSFGDVTEAGSAGIKFSLGNGGDGGKAGGPDGGKGGAGGTFGITGKPGNAPGGGGGGTDQAGYGGAGAVGRVIITPY